ncbi:MAG: ABC transporter permease [Chitinophagales bacterium]|nr:ABC transporter permease [Chitinophagales bacterium]
MNKILLIIRREYLSRVRKRVFIITTLLAPLILASFTILPVYLASVSMETENIAVLDKSEIFTGKLHDHDKIKFSYLNESNDSLQKHYEEKGYTGILYIPAEFNIDHPANAEYYSHNQLGLLTEGAIADEMNGVLKKLRLEKANVPPELLENIDKSEVQVVQSNDQLGDTGIATAVGYILGFMIYITLILYGTLVMRGVMEEKSNRIAEVIISSVKPFQLMMGKILGIGFVGLTQFIIWIVLVTLIQSVLTGYYSNDLHQLNQVSNIPGAAPQGNIPQMANIVLQAGKLPLALIASGFIFFFLGGYLLYASVFAAIGAAAGDESDQSLTFIATFPIIISFLILISVMNQPNSKLAIITSLIPFTSPVIMTARLAFEPPAWQIVASMVLLAFGFFFMVWLAAKIYRTGILMYGKKTSLKEMLKWVRY